MPQYPTPPFKQWLDEEPSVVESPIERGLRTASKWLGLGGLGPAENPIPMETGVVAPLISIFKDKAARMLSTEAFKDSAAAAAQKMGAPAVQEAAERFAGQYPRVAAHMRILDAPKVGTWSGEAGVSPYGVTDPVPVRFHTRGVASLQDPSFGFANALDTIYHEGTHVAQGLGNKDLRQLYAYANDVVGYDRNPFEISAFNTGEAAAKGLPRPTHPYNAIEGLRQITKDYTPTAQDLAVRPSVQNLKPVEQIRRYLDLREKWGKTGFEP